MSIYTFTSQYNLNTKMVWTSDRKVEIISFVCSYLMENIAFPPCPNIFWFMVIDLLGSINLWQRKRITVNGHVLFCFVNIEKHCGNYQDNIFFKDIWNMNSRWQFCSSPFLELVSKPCTTSKAAVTVAKSSLGSLSTWSGIRRHELYGYMVSMVN